MLNYKIVGEEWVTTEDVFFLHTLAQNIMSGRSAKDNVKAPSGWHVFFKWEGGLWNPHTVYCQTACGSVGVIFGKWAN